MKDQKPGSFPDSLKYANVRPIYKKLESFDKKTFGPVHYHFYQSLWKSESQRESCLNLFSMKFWVNLEKHLVPTWFIWIINIMVNFVK